MLRDLLKELKEGALPAVRGVGSGASLGFVKYPSAALMVLMDQVMAKNPNLTMSEALQLINEQQASDRENNPVASYGGEVLGSLVPGAAAARVATTLPAAIGAGAAQGAAAGFNERQDLGDAGVGALLGTAGVAGGRMLDKGREVLVRRTLADVGRQRVDEAAQAIQVQRQTLATPGISAAETKRLEKSIRSLEQSRKVGETQVKIATLGSPDLVMAASRPAVGLQKVKAGPIAKSAIGDVFGTRRAQIASRAGDTLAPTLLGAGAGYLGAQALGFEDQAHLAALLGGFGGRFGAGLTQKKLATAAAIPPARFGAGAGSVGSQTAARMAAGEMQARETSDEFEQFADPTGEVDEFEKYAD